VSPHFNLEGARLIWKTMDFEGSQVPVRLSICFAPCCYQCRQYLQNLFINRPTPYKKQVNKIAGPGHSTSNHLRNFVSQSADVPNNLICFFMLPLLSAEPPEPDALPRARSLSVSQGLRDIFHWSSSFGSTSSLAKHAELSESPLYGSSFEALSRLKLALWRCWCPPRIFTYPATPLMWDMIEISFHRTAQKHR